MKQATYKVALVLVLIFLNYLSKGQNDLKYYIANGLANSPLMQDYKNQTEAFRLEAERLKAFYTQPQVTLTANYLFAPLISRDSGNTGFRYNDVNATNYYGYDLAASNGGMYQGLINMTQPVFNGIRYRTTAEQANTQANVFQNNAQLTGHDVEKFITDQYILCLQDQNQIGYFTSLTALIKEQIGILGKLVQSGIMKQSDLLLVQIEYKTQLTALNTFQATYRRDLMDLNVLAGINDTSLVRIQELDLPITPDVTENSKYLIRYRLDSLNLVTTRNVFNLKYKPLVNLFANSGLNAVGYRTIPQRFGMSAGVNLSWYLYDGGQRRINNLKTSTLIKSTQAYKNIFITQNEVRKNKSLKELEMLEQRLVLMKSQMEDYNKLLDYYRQELVRGQISVINYLNVLKSSILVNRDFLILQAQKQLIINTYNYWNW